MNDRHTLTVTNKARANRASLETLFKPVGGKTATTHGRYDRGKYASNLHGRTADVPLNVVALYTVRRKDKDGPYWALYCISTH